MGNFTGELFTLPDRAESFKVLLVVVAVLAITAIWGPKTPARRRTSPAAGDEFLLRERGNRR
jgi:hypothetical protein